jgi:hypothetical protein
VGDGLPAPGRHPVRRRRRQGTEFYTKQAGFTLDVDYRPASDFRVVQLTPPGSACSVQIGTGLTDVADILDTARDVAVTR